MRKRRWSARQKAKAAMRVIKGESIEQLARELKVPSGDIYDWHERFKQYGLNGLKEKPVSAESRELEEAQKTIGKLTMENVLLKKKRPLESGNRQEGIRAR